MGKSNDVSGRVAQWLNSKLGTGRYQVQIAVNLTLFAELSYSHLHLAPVAHESSSYKTHFKWGQLVQTPQQQQQHIVSDEF